MFRATTNAMGCQTRRTLTLYTSHKEFSQFPKTDYYLLDSLTCQSTHKMPASFCVSDACLCCWTGYTCDECKPGCGLKREFLCLVEECCLSLSEESLGIGMITNADNKEYCKIGLGFCALGLKPPESLHEGVIYACCMRSAGSFPFDERTVESFTCACCFLSCAPECGFCVEPKAAVAFGVPLKDYSYKQEAGEVENEAMER